MLSSDTRTCPPPPGASFSLDQHWSEILHLFESHFHIRGARCSLAMLGELAHRYQTGPPYLRTTVAQLTDVSYLAQKGLLTKGEMDLHGEAIAGKECLVRLLEAGKI